MRTFRSYAIVTLAVLGLAAAVTPLWAQSQSSDLLTSKQAQELAMTAKTPAEHATLQKHFLALAAKYDGEAADHSALSRAEGKNPDLGAHFPGSATFRAKHCDQLSASLKDAAKDAREIAADHGKIAVAHK